MKITAQLLNNPTKEFINYLFEVNKKAILNYRSDLHISKAEELAHEVVSYILDLRSKIDMNRSHLVGRYVSVSAQGKIKMLLRAQKNETVELDPYAFDNAADNIHYDTEVSDFENPEVSLLSVIMKGLKDNEKTLIEEYYFKGGKSLDLIGKEIGHSNAKMLHKRTLDKLRKAINKKNPPETSDRFLAYAC